jgi:hypothetical protein
LNSYCFAEKAPYHSLSGAVINFENGSSITFLFTHNGNVTIPQIDADEWIRETNRKYARGKSGRHELLEHRSLLKNTLMARNVEVRNEFLLELQVSKDELDADLASIM